MEKITEKESNYKDLDQMSVSQLLDNINKEDQTVAFAVKKVIPQIEKLVSAIVEKMKTGGRLFYIGAGTSGRLGIIDASECPPTFGVSADLVTALIAGGDSAIRFAVENAEDNKNQAWEELETLSINHKDVVIGIASSGTTPYVLAGLKKSNENGVTTGCIVCNYDSPIARCAAFPIEVVTGPEFLTGSSRMKAGTATKMVLNMISTAVMIRLGKVKGNKMVEMKLSNAKLQDRGIKMVMAETGLDYDMAASLLATYNNVRLAIANAADYLSLKHN